MAVPKKISWRKEYKQLITRQLKGYTLDPREQNRLKELCHRHPSLTRKRVAEVKKARHKTLRSKAQKIKVRRIKEERITMHLTRSNHALNSADVSSGVGVTRITDASMSQWDLKGYVRHV